MARINAGTVIALLVVGFFVADYFILHTGVTDRILGFIPDNNNSGDGESSRFTVTFVKRGDVTTTLGTAVFPVWQDRNKNNLFEFDEVELCTSSSGVITTTFPYEHNKPIWIQTGQWNETYAVEYHEVMITGTKNEDGSAKTLPFIECTLLSDDVEYHFIGGGSTLDDGTDWDISDHSGGTGVPFSFSIFITLVTTDTGFTSGDNPFSTGQEHTYYNWEAGGEQHEMLPFIGCYMTNQDAIDCEFIYSEWDVYDVGATNTFLAKYLTEEMINEDCFYDANEANAPAWSGFTFTMHPAAAAELLSFGIYFDVDADDFLKFEWNSGTDAYNLGTLATDLSIVA